MAGQDLPHNPAKALEYKEAGNKCFQAGDYTGAEALYTKAINNDPTNPLFFTNRAQCLLKLSSSSSLHPSNSNSTSNYTRVTTDCQSSIALLPVNLKAYFFLAQAQIALHLEEEALVSGMKAHKLCVEECYTSPPGKGASNIRPITDLVLRCKKELWERKERERLRARGGLLEELVEGLELKRNIAVQRGVEVDAAEGKSKGEIDEGVKRVEDEYRRKTEELRSTFEIAGIGGEESKRRAVPDWCVDDITFSVILDPVVTKTGQSYDRSSLMEHLRRSETDPLTREPLKIHELRPNLALKAACAEFLDLNGWAVDW